MFLFLAGRFTVSSIPPSQLLLYIIRVLDDSSVAPFTVVYCHTACGMFSQTTPSFRLLCSIRRLTASPRLVELTFSSSGQECLRFSHQAVSDAAFCFVSWRRDETPVYRVIVVVVA